jgi:phenylalanyl-tRNA synthetase beta chain
LCFDFGIELDKDTENDPSRPKDQAPELAIEIPANRYDMLCFEGRRDTRVLHSRMDG